MKITKKITSIVLALLLAVSAFAGLAITANAAAPTGTFTLDITKYDTPATATNSNDVIGTNGDLTGTTKDQPASGNKLAGVVFEMVKVADWNTAAPSLAEAAAAYARATDNDKKKSQPTDADGHTTIETDVAGIYYVVEKSGPAKVTASRTGFLVSLPMTAKDTVEGSRTAGEDLLYTVYVYPKNLTTLGAAKLTKTINNVAYNANNITVAPIFELKDADGTLIATFTLATSTEIASATKNTNLDKYSTVTVNAIGGVMYVDGLPMNTTYNADGSVTATDATYTWSEKSGATLADDTVIPTTTATSTFTVNTTSTIDVTTGNTTYGTPAEDTIDNSAKPTIQKAVQTTDGTYVDNSSQTTPAANATYEIGDTFNWKITVHVPADIANYKKYVITDNIETTLDYVSTTVGSLTATTDYNITAPDVDEDGLITITLVDTANNVNPSDALKALADTDLEITVATKINDSAAVNTAIKNRAILAFDNNNGTAEETPSKEPQVWTGGIKVLKVDASNNATTLDGVEFELQDANDQPVYVTGSNGVYTVTQTAGSNKVVTANGGKIDIKGLQYGNNNYKLVETKTNAGYQLLTTPREFSVSADTYGNLADITIENVKQPDLPLTGGMGTILFTVAGLALIGGSAFFFIRSRKSRKEEI
ncbi:MAG: SpaH/EbpB family LPXTG-anchored major pilin [Acutalibacteraceae bacterium]